MFFTICIFRNIKISGVNISLFTFFKTKDFQPNDESIITEIISGLKEGDQIITKTVSSGSTTKSLSDTSSNNSNRPGDMMGGNPMGGQAVRSIMR